MYRGDSSFDILARWQPVTESARSRRSYGKIEDCEQSKLAIAEVILLVASTRTKSIQKQIKSIDVDKVGSKKPLRVNHVSCRINRFLISRSNLPAGET